MYTTHKAWVAAIGTTLTSAATAWASVQVALSDGSLDSNDIAAVVVAVLTAASTIYGVWRVPNQKKTLPPSDLASRWQN